MDHDLDQGSGWGSERGYPGILTSLKSGSDGFWS